MLIGVTPAHVERRLRAREISEEEGGKRLVPSSAILGLRESDCGRRRQARTLCFIFNYVDLRVVCA
jgi:hypothetical protein